MNIFYIRENLSRSEIIISIILLVLLNFFVLKIAELRMNTLFVQLLYTARLTMFLFNIALCFFILQDISKSNVKYWLLFWTGSFVAYAVHIYYSYFLYFNGSITKFYNSQGVFVATLNLVITVWWTFDIILSWIINSDSKWISFQRTGIHILLFITFFASTVIFHAVDNKEVFVIIMGILLGVSTLICLYIRIRFNSLKSASSRASIIKH